MFKKSFFGLILVAGVVLFFKSELLLQTPILNFSNGIKLKYLNGLEGIRLFIKKYFNQAEQIEFLLQENNKLMKDRMLLNGFASEILKLSSLKKYNKKFSPSIQAVRTISYSQIPDFQQLWIDYDKNTTSILGLIYNGMSAGIVTSSRPGISKVLLNGHPKCSYAVFVGESKAPGIVMGKNAKNMVVKYIPAYKKIKVGDKVFTSGLDKIFFAGLRVGVVEEIRTINAYQEAIVKPYFNTLSPDYFYVITKIH